MHDVLHESYQWNDKVYKYTNLNENHQVIKFILAENRKIRLILRIPRECTNPVTREQNALSHILVMRYPTACHTDSRNCSISLGLSNNRYMDLTSHILSTNLVTSVHVILIDYIALYDFDVSIHSKFLVYSDRSGNLFIIRSCFRRQKKKWMPNFIKHSQYKNQNETTPPECGALEREAIDLRRRFIRKMRNNHRGRPFSSVGNGYFNCGKRFSPPPTR